MTATLNHNAFILEPRDFMFRSPKIKVETLHYSPSVIRVMECGKPDVSEFKRRMKLKRCKLYE